MCSAKTEVENAINRGLAKIMFCMFVMALLALVITQSAQAQLSLVSGSSPAPVPTTANEHSVTSPSAFTVTSPCTAEDVLISGKTHMNSQNTESSSGNTRTRMFTHDEGTGQAPSGAGYSYADFNEMVTESKSNESGPSYISF